MKPPPKSINPLLNLYKHLHKVNIKKRMEVKAEFINITLLPMITYILHQKLNLLKIIYIKGIQWTSKVHCR